MLLLSLINPGATRTQMRAKAFPGENSATLPAPEDLVPLFLELASPLCQRNGDVVKFRDWRPEDEPSSTRSPAEVAGTAEL